MLENVVAERVLAERLLAERVLATGTVKWFNPEGCGVISPDEGDDDLFFRSRFATLSAGARVEFEVDEGPAGLEAFNVLRLAPVDEARPAVPPLRAAARPHAARARRY